MAIAETWSDLWSRATATQPPPEPGFVLLLAIAALLLVWHPTTWHWVRHLVTVVHEAGHAFVALLVGRRLSGIRLHSDTSGLTVSRGKPRGPGMVAMLAAGYLAPAAVGLGAAALLAAGHGLAVLWLLLVALLLMFVQIRNWYGALVLLVIGAATFTITWYLSPAWQSGVAYAITWSLLLAAPKPVLELISQRRGGRRTGSDADQLARHTPLPAGLWTALFLVANLAGLVVGVTTLLPVPI